MTQRNKTQYGKTLLNIIFGVPTLFSMVGKVFKMVGFEARLAGHSLVNIIILSTFFALMGALTWSCILGFLLTYLVASGWSLMAGFGLLIGINLIILIALGFAIKRHKQHLFFHETRRRARHVKETFEDF